MVEEKRFAILIDAENISSKYVKYIMDEMSNYGIVTYKRIYADWTQSNSSTWKKVLSEYALSPMQQYSYSTGKNSTDSAMVIDAMDILYTERVDGFCIVSSDSDFTKLALRLKESGMMVIGMGEEKTPKAFSNACNAFKYLNIIADEEDDAGEKILASSNLKEKDDDKSFTDIKIISREIRKILTDREDVNISELGNLLVKRYPDFDSRNYGYSKLSKFLQSQNFIEVYKKGNSMFAALNKSADELIIQEVNQLIKNRIKSSGNVVTVGEIGNHICREFPDFDFKNYGYSKLSRYLENQKFLNTYIDNNIMYVKLVDNELLDKMMINSYVVKLIDESKDKRVTVSELSTMIRAKFPEFNLKEFGFSKFSKFIKTLNCITIYRENDMDFVAISDICM